MLVVVTVVEDWRFARGPSWGSRALIGRRAKGDKRHHVSSSYHHVYRTFSSAYFDLSAVMAGNRQRTLGTTRMLLSGLLHPPGLHAPGQTVPVCHSSYIDVHGSPLTTCHRHANKLTNKTEHTTHPYTCPRSLWDGHYPRNVLAMRARCGLGLRLAGRSRRQQPPRSSKC